jgi:hypothetical protein
MRFNIELVDDFFKLSKQVMDAMKLHQWPHLINSLDQTGFQVTCNSCNQRLLDVEGSKRVPTATRGENGETVTLVVCMVGSGSDCITPVVLYKGKYKKEEFVDAFNAGIA